MSKKNLLYGWGSAALAGLLLACPLGCASWRDTSTGNLVSNLDLPDGVPWKSEEPRRGAPRRMVVTWTDTVKQQPGHGAQRGFGGRIFFYDTSEPKPIGVEGQLVVYAFDETNRLPTDNRPTKRFVFPPEQFALHESDSDLGLSYSVWLPWDEVGRPQTDVSLIARFEPLRGGTLIVSDQTRQRLPGSIDASQTNMLAASDAGPAKVIQAGGIGEDSAAVQAAAFETPPQNNPGATAGLETTTIKLGAKALQNSGTGSARTTISYGHPSR